MVRDVCGMLIALPVLFVAMLLAFCAAVAGAIRLRRTEIAFALAIDWLLSLWLGAFDRKQRD